TEKDKIESQVIHYLSEDFLVGIPTHDYIVIENNKGLTTIFKNALSKHQDILFMAVDVEESTEFINGQA
ncbi:11915_t:CDS:1, partial [Cetraspora pellucida]